MALTSYAMLSANGSDIVGEPSQTSLGPIDVTGHLEVYEVEFGSERTTGGTTGRRGGRRTLGPVVLHTRLDQATPVLFQALTEGHRIDGVLRLFDVDPDTGAARNHFSIVLERSAIAGVHALSPDNLDQATSARPATVMVEIQPHTITYIDEVHATEYTESA